MKKIVWALVFSLLMLSLSFSSYAAEEIIAVDGNVTIACATDAQEGTPVAIFILPQILDGAEDVTAQRVGEVSTPEELAALGAEYIAYEKVGANGILTHTCEMKDSLSTGKCVVVFSFVGKQAYKAGEFEHVGKTDINTLVGKFNSAAATGYDEIIAEDMNGVEGAPAKGVLGKSSADVEYYSSLSNKTEFCELLFAFKPADGGFSLVTLVEKFNEAGVWIRLRTEENTLSVLETYNGEGLGKYWNISIGETSDFASLSSDEKTSILKEIKKAKLSKEEDLAKVFTDNVVLAMFRRVATREDLGELISADSAYAAYFAGVREIIADADLSSHKTDILYNNVLKSNDKIISISDIEELFEESIPEDSSGGGSSGGGKVSISGGYKSSTKGTGTNVNPTPNQNNVFGNSFGDVGSNHWAFEYVDRLSKSGVINGVGANEFAPSKQIARQDFVKILVGALGMELSDGETVFDDAESGAYYEKYIMTAYEDGLVSGIDEKNFGVGQNISRQDAAVILSRVLNNKGIVASGESAVFADGDEIADYAKDAVAKVSSAKIFSGDESGKFNPKDSLTRAETCAIICRLIDLVKGE